MHFRKIMGCLSQKMSPLEVISTDQWNLSFFSAFLEQRMNKYGMIKLVDHSILHFTSTMLGIAKKYRLIIFNQSLKRCLKGKKCREFSG